MPIPRPTIAVIPHYNQAETIPWTLASLEGQGYADAVVLDDCSSRDQREVVQYYAGEHGATFIAGERNLGAAGNRGRIIGEYPGTDLHFIDADTTLISQNTAARVRDALSAGNVGMGGGLVRNPDGSQLPWNYGPSFTLKAHLGGLTQLRLAEIAKTDPAAASRKRETLKPLIGAWPDTTETRKAEPFWVAEANLFIRANTLREIGGFPRVRHHDIQGPAIELARKGLRTVFDPAIEVTHYPYPEGGRREQLEHIAHIAAATGYLAARYGPARFLFGGDNASSLRI